MKTNFFTEWSKIKLNKVSIEINFSDTEKLTVFVTPKTGSNAISDMIVPFSLSATAEELDAQFFEVVTKPLIETAVLITNVEEFLTQQEEAKNKLADEKLKKEQAKTEKETKVTPVVKAPTLTKEEKAKADKIKKAEEKLIAYLARFATPEDYLLRKNSILKEIETFGELVDNTGELFLNSMAKHAEITKEVNLFEAPVVEKEPSEEIAEKQKVQEELVEEENDDLPFSEEEEVSAGWSKEEIAQQELVEEENNDLALKKEIELEELESNSEPEPNRIDLRIQELIGYEFVKDEISGIYHGLGFEVKPIFITDYNDEYWNDLISAIAQEQYYKIKKTEAVPIIDTLQIPKPAPMSEPVATTFKMLPSAQYSEEQYSSAGWSKEQMVQQGLAEWILVDNKLPPAPMNLVSNDDDNDLI